MLHPQIGGVWAREISVFGEVTVSSTWPHGCDSASWTIPEGTSHPALRANAPVVVKDGGLVVWRGILQEPGRDGKVTARGLWTLAEDVLALDTYGNATRVPDVAIDAAIARGALPGWSRPTTLSAGAWGDPTSGDLTVAALLDRWAAGAGVRWGVDANGVVYASADPTAPSFVVPSAAAGRGLALAEDEFVTHLVGRYLTSTETAATLTVQSTDAATKWGRKEVTVDLTPMGVISAATAQAQLEGMFALSGGRMHFSEGLELAHGQITTLGGAPVPLSKIPVGARVRLHGVADRTRPTAAAAYTDITIGRVSYTDGSGRVLIDPTDLAARSLSDILKVATEGEDETAADPTARAQIAATAADVVDVSNRTTTAQNTANAANGRILRHISRQRWEIGTGGYPNGSGTTIANVYVTAPAGANMITVHYTQPAHADTNAAGYFDLGVGGVVNSQRIHTLGANVQNLGSLTASMYAEASCSPGQVIQVFVNFYVDSGGGWIATHPGNLTVNFSGVY